MPAPACATHATAALPSRFVRLLPGLALCLIVTAAAYGAQAAESALWGKAWIEALVLAILLGAAARSLWTPPESWRAGVEFGAAWPLEIGGAGAEGSGFTPPDRAVFTRASHHPRCHSGLRRNDTAFLSAFRVNTAPIRGRLGG